MLKIKPLEKDSRPNSVLNIISWNRQDTRTAASKSIINISKAI